jgi:hypothetical protein
MATRRAVQAQPAEQVLPAPARLAAVQSAQLAQPARALAVKVRLVEPERARSVQLAARATVVQAAWATVQ